VYLDESSFSAGGGDPGPSCCVCKAPILQGQSTTRLYFETDPNGAKGLTGMYHVACSKPFDSLANAINMMSRLGR
jgi:hypothetical protein